MSVPVLVGESVVLRPIQPADRAARQRHGWHAEIERNYGTGTLTRAMTDEEATEWYTRWELAADGVSRMHWVIDDGEMVGEAFLYGIRPEDRRARYAVGLYAPSFLRRGLGGQTTRLVLHHAFGVLGLHRVDLRVLDFNQGAIAAYRSCGFLEEGREREVCFVDGRWHDDIVMGVLEHEFPTARSEVVP